MGHNLHNPRQMRKALAMVLLTAPLLAFANNNPVTSEDKAEVLPRTQTVNFDSPEQQRLAKSEHWQAFKSNHPNWRAAFNEANSLPHRAFGSAIPVAGADTEAKALNFMASELEAFNLEGIDLQLVSTPVTSKHEYANFIQYFNGIEVLNSRLMVKIHANGVVAYGCDVYPNIDLNLTPTISDIVAVAAATEGIEIELGEVQLSETLKILVLPEAGQTAHLCMELYVNATQDNNVPARYRCLVDAHTGDLIYRVDEVKSINKCPKCKKAKKVKTMGMVDVDAHVSAELYPVSLLEPTETLSLGNLLVTVGGTNYYTDADGNLSIAETGPLNATLSLEGLWSQVNTDDVIPSFGVNIADGVSEISFDGEANIKELSAYYSVNGIHDWMKQWMPDFDGLDYSMPTNIDVDGTCNAFYDGEINFYDAGGGCNATSLLADVVYHEYGHGINSVYYGDNGMNFNNGAMHEGYADWWAISLTGNPHLGQGFFDDTTDGIRRYDIDPKVYPQDLVGEVHADGEIICGAWYDTHLLMGGDWNASMELFVNTYAGFQAVGMGGNEGEIFFDVLLDALQEDDDNGDLEDGTPNDLAIIEGFAIHGIYLLAGAEIIHENPLTSNADEDVLIDAEVLIQFPFGIYLDEVGLFYRINDELVWTTVEMTNTDGDNWQANLGPQEAGTVIAYYIGLTDTYGNLTRVDPLGAGAADDPTLPHYTIVGMETVMEHDADFNEDFGEWQAGAPSDLATAGVWELNIPIGSFGDPFDPTTMMAPDHDHTGAEFAFITEQASDPTASMYNTDVDDGGTTLRSPAIDLTDFEEPVISYWRWLAHLPAGNPNFALTVDVSNGDGNWVTIEKTITQDRSWRRNVFRVQDYLGDADEIILRFFADDPIFEGSGALVESAVDDVYLWDLVSTSVDDGQQIELQLYPNPAEDVVYINGLSPQASVLVWSVDGKLLETITSPKMIDVSDYAAGVYIIEAVDAGISATQKLVIEH